jgi:hypothetical protein
MRRSAIGMSLALVMALAMGMGLAGPARADPCCGPITPAGQRLARFLDGTGVDHRWLAGHHVDWLTGVATFGTSEKATHCSAFVAAAADRLGVYVLRPPDHSEDLLANAQLRWLRDAPTGSGWRSLPDPVAAQAAANRGDLVLEAFENPNPRRPGHIAIVRPSEQSRADLDRDGPRETQAGETNALDTFTAQGFRHHPGAWVPEGQGGIRYYVHAINWALLP